MKTKSIIMVVVQIATIMILCITARPVCNRIVLLVIQALSLLLLGWTWFNLKPGKFHIAPDIIKEEKLVTTGPFRFIRHPMYLSLFMYLVPLVINYFSWIRLAVLLIFVVNMIIKLFYEEKILTARFPDYIAYMKRTYRLLPYIF